MLIFKNLEIYSIKKFKKHWLLISTLLHFSSFFLLAKTKLWQPSLLSAQGAEQIKALCTMILEFF